MLSETEEKEAMDGHRTIEVVAPLLKTKNPITTAIQSVLSRERYKQ